MLKISKTYNPKEIEEKWYKHWLKKEYFYSSPNDKKAYTIVIPPPNVTGVLHMGHMLNNTLQDIIIRRARMKGFNTCWVPGTDHASIATEAKVVNKLSEKGIKKTDLTREEFLKHAWEWKEEHGGIILEQLKKLGASCDWKRTKFTMDEDMSESVIKVFVDLYRKGYIYRGIRMVNWDPSAQTAVSDEEVIHKEVYSKLYHISYKIQDSEEVLVIATTRPETILGDSAVCLNPNDPRYNKLKGKKVIVPLVNRVVPIIFDEYVDMEFGTGALKITPAHDINDYIIGDKHNLEIIEILNDDGTLNNNATLYIGKDRFDARKEIICDLKNKGLLVKVEEHQNKIGFSERTDTIIEPKLSMQWFCKMEKLAKPALKHVMNDDITFHPPKFKNTYRHWMENIKDWCISRQLWWGQQIPVYYYKGNKFIVAETKQEALRLAKKEYPSLSIKDLRQDADVLDTWFSSWIWPISVFDGVRNPKNKEISYYYPTNDLVTGPDILFFWVARMIMSGYEYKKELPFKNVYFTGIVRDIKGRKMSKTLGNSPDPIKLINKYSADGVRVGMLLCSPAGNDLPFDENLCEQGRNFANKLWNVLRLIKGWESVDNPQKDAEIIGVNWFEHKINQEILRINKSFEEYRISEALMISYKLIWNDFCSTYLEIVKPEYGKPISKLTYDYTIDYLKKILKIIHPFMPFISEEIWHLIKTKNTNKDIIISKWPETKPIDKNIIKRFDTIVDLISKIRKIKKEQSVNKNDKSELLIKHSNSLKINDLKPVIKKLGNLSKISQTKEKEKNTFSFMIGSGEYFMRLNKTINIEDERIKLNKELDYNKGFLKIIEGKINNQNFINKAPSHLVENEKNKMKDTVKKIKILEEKIKEL